MKRLLVIVGVFVFYLMLGWSPMIWDYLESHTAGQLALSIVVSIGHAVWSRDGVLGIMFALLILAGGWFVQLVNSMSEAMKAIEATERDSSEEDFGPSPFSRKEVT